jgi:hypothetical protein
MNRLARDLRPLTIRVLRAGVKRFFLEDQLRELAEQYRTGEKELVQACDAITDRNGRPLRPGERIVTQY